MKAKGIKSEVKVTDTLMQYKATDVGSGQSEAIALDLGEVFPGFAAASELVQRALQFGARTKLRNATAGKEFPEAVEAIRGIIADWLDGKWAGARAAGGEGRSSLLVLAICEVAPDKYTPETAAALVNGKVAAAMQAKGIDPDSEEEADIKEVRKIRAAVTAAFLEKPKVKAAYERLKAQRATERAAAAEKAAAAAPDDSGL